MLMKRLLSGFHFLTAVHAACSQIEINGQGGRNGYEQDFESGGASIAPIGYVVNCTMSDAVVFMDRGGDEPVVWSCWSEAAQDMVYFTAEPTLNISMSGEARQSVFRAVIDQVGGCDGTFDFNDKVAGRYTGGGRGAIRIGETVVMVWASTMKCWEGVLGGCDEDETEGRDGDTVKACAPAINQNADEEELKEHGLRGIIGTATWLNSTETKNRNPLRYKPEVESNRDFCNGAGSLGSGIKMMLGLTILSLMLQVLVS